MYTVKLPVALAVLSLVFHHLKATSIESQEWTDPVLTRNMLLELRGAKSQHEGGNTQSHQMEKRRCNTVTCATQRLTNFLTRSSNNIGAIPPSTNVGSNTYGKRNTAEMLNREPLHYLPL